MSVCTSHALLQGEVCKPLVPTPVLRTGDSLKAESTLSSEGCFASVFRTPSRIQCSSSTSPSVSSSPVFSTSGCCGRSSGANDRFTSKHVSQTTCRIVSSSNRWKWRPRTGPPMAGGRSVSASLPPINSTEPSTALQCLESTSEARTQSRGSGVVVAQAKDTVVATTDKVMDKVDDAVPPGRAKPVTTPEVQKLLDCMKWDANGLVVAIAQHVDTGAVLMQGFADRDAVSATLASRRATFFSRSRQCLWTKGETSANFIHIVDVFLDCDRDSVIYLGSPDGPTCHTGEETCYFVRADDVVSGGLQYAKENKLQALTSLYSLENVIRKRAEEVEAPAVGEPPAKPSWTRKLLSNPELLCAKIREEADELCRTLEDSEGKERAASEMADLLYHAMVLLSLQGVNLEDVSEVLRGRFPLSGIEEKNRRKAT